MEEGKMITLNVVRYDPEKKQYVTSTYKVPAKKGMTLLDALLYIRDNLDGTLTVRHSCRMGLCGSCAVIANNKHVLACYTQLLDLGSDTITVTPLQNLPMIRDLVPDLKPFFERYKLVKPYLIRPEEDLRKDTEFLQSPEELSRYWDLTLCIKCALCYSSCPVLKVDKDFYGPAAIATIHRFAIDSRDKATKSRVEEITRNGLWWCARCYLCVEACPKFIKPGEAITNLKVLSCREVGVLEKGAKHAVAFKQNIEKYGILNEANLIKDTVGIGGLLKMPPLGLKMAIKGKLISPFQKPIPKIEEIRRIYEEMRGT